MDIRGTDPLDVEWDVDAPAYRVYFHSDGGSVSDEFELRQADVDEVLAWAASRAGGRQYVVYVMHDERGSLGLIRLIGSDPTEGPLDTAT